MLGGMALQWKWRERRRAAGKPTDKPNIVTGPVQICWHKFARYWDVEIREIPMEGDRLIMTPEEVVKRVRREHDRRRADARRDVHVPVRAGRSRQRGARQASSRDRARHSDSRRRRQRRLPRAVHRPGARVGLPAPAREVDQHVRSQVRARAAGRRLGHLAGRGGPARGPDLQRQLSRRQHADLRAQLLPARADRSSRSTTTSCVSAARATARSIRPATTTRSTWREAIAKHGSVRDHLRRDAAGIPALAWKLEEGVDHGFTLFDLADRLRTTGWQVPAYTLPKNREDLAIQRILVRHDFSRDLGELLLDDYKRALAAPGQAPGHEPVDGARGRQLQPQLTSRRSQR